jgi:hypothetical protein
MRRKKENTGKKIALGAAVAPELNKAVKQARQAAKNLGKFFKS